MIASLAKTVTFEEVAQTAIKRLAFTFELDVNTNTLPSHLDSALEVFSDFNRTRNADLIPDCIAFDFNVYSRKPVDLPALYAQLREFVDPFVSKGWHTPSLAVYTHYTPTKKGYIEVSLRWQDKTFEQYIRRPFATWRCEK